MAAFPLRLAAGALAMGTQRFPSHFVFGGQVEGVATQRFPSHFVFGGQVEGVAGT
jgi:hypothetical protein